MGVDAIGKNVAGPQARDVFVQAGDVGQSAAEHDDIRVQKVDDRGQRARQTLLVAAQGGAARFVAGGGELGDLVGGQILTAVAHMVGGESRAR